MIAHEIAGLFVSFLVLAANLDSNAFWKAAPKSEDTKIDEVSFRLTLPGPWKSGNTNDPKKRAYHTETEQLTVSIFGSLFGVAGAMKHAEKVDVFRRWVNKRRDVETKMPGLEGVEVTEPTFGESQGVLAGRYTGFDSARKRRLHCLILASSSAFEIFYYEATDVAERTAEDRAKAIFNSVDIPK